MLGVLGHAEMHNQNVQLQSHLRSEMDVMIAQHYLVNVVEGGSACSAWLGQKHKFFMCVAGGTGVGLQGGWGWMECKVMGGEVGWPGVPPVQNGDINLHSNLHICIQVQRLISTEGFIDVLQIKCMQSMHVYAHTCVCT